MSKHSTVQLQELYLKAFGQKPESITPIPGAGSNRKYFRLTGKETVIGAMDEVEAENEAFTTFSNFFKQQGLAVPEIFAYDKTARIYLQEDLGNIALLDLRLQTKDDPGKKELTDTLYKKSLSSLIDFQIAGKKLDPEVFYPTSKFGVREMLWDLNYFKYYYLKPAGIPFNEALLEKDFEALLDHLKGIDNGYFMYRDFQARNIMIKNGEPHFIDYQGGRFGPLQYDVVSLLFQAKANLSPEERKTFLNHYLKQLRQKHHIEPETFLKHYHAVILLRLLQVLGAYGFRGYFERKPHFIESARHAMQNIDWFLKHHELPFDLPELIGSLRKLLAQINPKPAAQGLTVKISSFSYLKYGYPKDDSGNGGGFVFDCRALPNPGRYPEYRQLTGRDQQVIDFLQKEEAVDQFLQNVFEITNQAVANYLERGFQSLTIDFGCTGGQHRSVYCAENLFRMLNEKFRVNLKLEHKMLSLSSDNQAK